jgi:hypothetical protein
MIRKVVAYKKYLYFRKVFDLYAKNISQEMLRRDDGCLHYGPVFDCLGAKQSQYRPVSDCLGAKQSKYRPVSEDLGAKQSKYRPVSEDLGAKQSKYGLLPKIWELNSRNFVLINNPLNILDNGYF